MTSWYERRNDVDEHAPSDLDPFTAALLRDYIRPGTPGDQFRALTYVTCKTCLTELDDDGYCDGCGQERSAA